MLNKYVFLDKRIIKTQSSIKYALLNLLIHKELSHITVSDIVKAAGISRVSFYNHYDNKEDLINETMDEIVEDFVNAYRGASQNLHNFKINDLNLSSVKVFDHVYRNSLFYTAVVNSNLIIKFTEKLIVAIKALWVTEYKLLNSNIDNQLYTVHNIYAIIGLIIEWVKEDYKYSPKYMAQQLISILHMSPNQSIQKASS